MQPFSRIMWNSLTPSLETERCILSPNIAIAHSRHHVANDTFFSHNYDTSDVRAFITDKVIGHFKHIGFIH